MTQSDRIQAIKMLKGKKPIECLDIRIYRKLLALKTELLLGGTMGPLADLFIARKKLPGFTDTQRWEFYFGTDLEANRDFFLMTIEGSIVHWTPNKWREQVDEFMLKAGIKPNEP